MCIVKRVAGSRTLFGDSFELKLISIENDSSKLAHSFFYRTFFKTTFIRHELAYVHSDHALLFLCMSKPCVLASLWALNTAKTQRTQHMPMLNWVFALCTWFSDVFVQMRFSLSKVYSAQFFSFEYFELKNIPFGQLVYWSVVTLPHFRKDHFSRKICIQLGNF